MNRVLITNASERVGVAFARDLRRAGEFHTIGVDSNPSKLQRVQTDEKMLMPSAHEDDYLDVMRAVVNENGIDLVIVTRQVEMERVAKERESVGTRTFLPKIETLELCKDKIASNQVWTEAGVPVPPSKFINNREDLEQAFDELGPELWLRHIGGAGGKGALPVSDMKTGTGWIDLNDGWGHFMAATRLTTRTVTWESIWQNGKLIAAQGRERHYWEFGGLAPSGVTGITGSGETVSDDAVGEIALKAIRAVDPEPHGLMGVDMTYDHSGVPCVTEINAGRFMNGGVVLYSPAFEPGESFPYMTTMAGLDTIPGDWTPKVNPLEPGITCVRGMDVEPVLLTRDDIKQTTDQMAALRSRVAAMKS